MRHFRGHFNTFIHGPVVTRAQQKQSCLHATFIGMQFFHIHTCMFTIQKFIFGPVYTLIEIILPLKIQPVRVSNSSHKNKTSYEAKLFNEYSFEVPVFHSSCLWRNKISFQNAIILANNYEADLVANRVFGSDWIIFVNSLDM